MAMPQVRKILLPLLQFAAEVGEAISAGNAIDAMAQRLNLTPEERKERMRGGGLRFSSRVRFARWQLQRGGLVEPRGRGSFAITEDGRKHAQNPPEDFRALLKSLIAERELADQESGADESMVPQETGDETASHEAESDADKDADASPLEKIYSAYQEMRNSLEADALDRIQSMDPSLFEIRVLEVFKGLGYGARGGRTERTGGPKDRGVDGLILEDPLELERVVVQAKRYTQGNTVGEPDIRNFLGSMLRANVRKGIFVTSSHFTKDAVEAAKEPNGFRVRLIDGENLVRLMIKSGKGVSLRDTCNIYDIDESFFSED